MFQFVEVQRRLFCMNIFRSFCCLNVSDQEVRASAAYTHHRQIQNVLYLFLHLLHWNVCFMSAAWNPGNKLLQSHSQGKKLTPPAAACSCVVVVMLYNKGRRWWLYVHMYHMLPPKRGLYLEFVSPNILSKNVPLDFGNQWSEFFPQLSQSICLYHFVRLL